MRSSFALNGLAMAELKTQPDNRSVEDFLNGSDESMSKPYADTLKGLQDWQPFLLAESGLPGPRGNIELAQVVADLGNEEMFNRFLAFDAARAPVNSPFEFLAFCGVVGLGRLLAEGRRDVLPALRRHASDVRWRTREAVAMALQRWGRVDMDALLDEMETWTQGNLLECRAAIAAVCEPALLGDARKTERVLDLLDAVTASLARAGERRSDDFRALRKGLGYCWSVAVAALPDPGRERMELWFTSEDRDVRWVMRENLKKKRLARLDAPWATAAQQRLAD